MTAYRFTFINVQFITCFAS